MALTKEKKDKSLKSLKENISKQKSIVFIDFSKINSKDLFSLRKTLKEADCLLKIGKKTLMKIAFNNLGDSFWDSVKNSAKGQLALVLGFKDEVAPARISKKFSKVNENLKILGGIFENRFIEKEQVLVLADLPSKEELLAKLILSIKSPIAGFANIFQGNIRGLVTALSKINK